MTITAKFIINNIIIYLILHNHTVINYLCNHFTKYFSLMNIILQLFI